MTSEDAWLRKDGANLVVEVDGTERGRVAAAHAGRRGQLRPGGASPALMAACAEAGITVSYLDPNGRFLARVEGARTGNVLLRRTQYRAADDPARGDAIVRGDGHGEDRQPAAVAAPGAARSWRGAWTDGARDALDGGGAAADRYRPPCADRPAMWTSLRGLEGEAALTYFGVFAQLVRVTDPAFRFRGRSRRPPLDRINALLSFLYAMLGHDCRSALEAHGLDPQVGFLHADRPGRASLALDLMEELRPVLADRLALSLINRRQLAAGDFVVEEAGGVQLTDDARKAVLVAWQERKQEELRHPFLSETVPLGLVASVQAQLLARHLRGDLDGYPAFIWK